MEIVECLEVLHLDPVFGHNLGAWQSVIETPVACLGVVLVQNYTFQERLDCE